MVFSVLWSVLNKYIFLVVEIKILLEWFCEICLKFLGKNWLVCYMCLFEVLFDSMVNLKLLFINIWWLEMK